MPSTVQSLIFVLRKTSLILLAAKVPFGLQFLLALTHCKCLRFLSFRKSSVPDQSSCSLCCGVLFISLSPQPTLMLIWPHDLSSVGLRWAQWSFCFPVASYSLLHSSKSTLVSSQFLGFIIMVSSQFLRGLSGYKVRAHTEILCCFSRSGRIRILFCRIPSLILLIWWCKWSAFWSAQWGWISCLLESHIHSENIQFLCHDGKVNKNSDSLFQRVIHPYYADSIQSFFSQKKKFEM